MFHVVFHGDRFLCVVTRLDGEHTCSVDVSLTNHRQTIFSIIKDLIKKKINIYGPELNTSKDIVHYICCEHDLNISYQKAWRAHETAFDEVKGFSEDSFKMLPTFVYLLNLNNWGMFAIYTLRETIYTHDVHIIHYSLYENIHFSCPWILLLKKVVGEGRFIYFFMALSTSIFGWQSCSCCLVLSIDSISLKNKYSGTLLTGSTPSANDKIFL